MYLPCDTIEGDQCFRLDKYGPLWEGYLPAYSFEDIPGHCTAFFGAVSIVGAFDEDYLIGRFDNLKVIIGQLSIGNTLLDRLDKIFPKLEVVYPHRLDGRYLYYSNWCTRPRFQEISPFKKVVVQQGSQCGGYGYVQRNQQDFHSFPSVQYVHARINRFLTNWSIPTLLNIRPLDVGNARKANEYYRSQSGDNTYYIDGQTNTFLPDTVEDPCLQFPQFNGSCGSIITPAYVTEHLPTKCYPWENKLTRDDCVPFLYNNETYTLSLMCVAFGLALSFRAMVFLLFSKAKESFSSLNLLLLLVMFITTMVALESSFIYQKAMRFFGPKMHFLPQFESLHLFHPLCQWLMLILASSKHACLAIIALCYVNFVIFSVTRSHRLSLLSCILVLISFPVVTAYLNSQIFLAIRGVRPRYSQEPRQLLFIPFIASKKFVIYRFNIIPKHYDFENELSQLMPESVMLTYTAENTLYSPTMTYMDTGGMNGGTFPSNFYVTVTEFPLETFGQILPEFSYICDVGMFVATGLFLVFSCFRKFSSCRGLPTLLILLYVQLSINRIRFFSHDYVAVSDYCNYADRERVYWYPWFSYISCYDAGESLAEHYYYDDDGNTIGPYEYFPSVMTKYEWGIIERFFETLPHTFYLLVSYFCYKFARFHSYLGAAIDHKEAEKATQAKQTSGLTRSTQEPG